MIHQSINLRSTDRCKCGQNLNIVNVPDLEEEEDVDAVLVVHHDNEGTELRVKQVPNEVRGHHSIDPFAIKVLSINL